MRVIVSKGVRHSSSNPQFFRNPLSKWLECKWAASCCPDERAYKKGPPLGAFFDLVGDEASSSQDPNCMR